MKKVKKETFKQNLLRVINEGVNSTAEQEGVEWEWKKIYRALEGSVKQCDESIENLEDLLAKPVWKSSDPAWKDNKKAMDSLRKLKAQIVETRKAILQTIQF